ncbi:uncharacterized protein DUF4112 [Albidovulum inexpectatum]|uniref:Uncharacterized protein DUF4112 n=1 Tax=Albidovulum inexpectatum TaxID=196587 RepID=A0A2S5JI79_9RHOB|nr:DUF4112 domain-containing protein [Albidovulum inexpectatum]PPB81173.1 uncharacterized protein DUF4112 [Albidovulum inexpectatum]
MSDAKTQAPMQEPGHDRALIRARRLARLLDARLGIPGTRLRFGLDSILGLVPGLGDVATLAAGAYILHAGWRLGVPWPGLARMAGNLALDAVVGSVPLLGDVFDFAFKANLRNVAVIERHLAQCSGLDARGPRPGAMGYSSSD